jgi:superfamily II DNA or RNA helicase
MAKLEDLKRNTQVKGLVPLGTVTILNVQSHGPDVFEVTYRDVNGKDNSELLFRDREADLEVIEAGTPWAFDSDGELFRLVSEAYRIRMAYLFDPWMAVHLSQVEPLPHQITAVYGEMLPRQPLRFLLADDPGAGKTIMTGLFIKELMLRGDLQRCLIVVPGNLVEQWQDELYQKFQLDFELLTNDRINGARTGNALAEMPLVVARLDKLSRDEELQKKLAQTDWDLVVIDESHKCSASVFGGEIKYTKRYHLAELLSRRTRHLLMLTATPHNGKEEDFQLFMALIDPDRFEGKYREGTHEADASDLMRRLVKEKLLKFDGTPLFPERRAYTVTYELSELEAALYEQVTSYVREEFNRAEKLDKDRKGTVGFALTVLQRRLASSPEAIYQSLHRRRERLEARLREERLMKRGRDVDITEDTFKDIPKFSEEDYEDFDDAPETENEQTEEQVSDSASAARTIAELELEIARLAELEKLADKVRHSGQDRKWTELSRLLQDQAEMFDADGRRRKLVIFSEHRDTLNYLTDKIRTLLGKHEAVVSIHGGIDRDQRRAIQASFVQDKDVIILVATDAAGEGINLQRAHLMINYDLPWNPTRLEQRFGRIHRIGQTEVCHLWNLVSDQTREGEVYIRLLQKIEEQRKALMSDGVFDILGKLFRETSLRQLLMEAIRYGDQPEVKARLFQAVDNLADQEHVRELLEERSLAQDTLDVTNVRRIREDFERAQARRLQPHFIAGFFKAAFEHLGGTMHPREPLRFEITHVPAPIRNRASTLGRGPVLNKYERVTFDKEAIQQPGKVTAEFLCPGNPLMDAVTDLILERYRGLLRQGAILVDPTDMGEEPRVLYYLEHAIQDARPAMSGERRVISKQMQFVEINSKGDAKSAGPAPFHNYLPLEETSKTVIESVLETDWLRGDLEASIRTYAAQTLVPQHLQEVKARREESILKTEAAVKDRLTKEINYWDYRAAELKAQEQAGKTNARLNSDLARRRADELAARLQKRMEELEQERHISAAPPVIMGGALVIPAGLLAIMQNRPPSLFARQTKAVELAAMRAVMEQERKLGFTPKDVSADKVGWDIESQAGEGKLRFIEVKGRVEGATTVTVTKTEILAALNKPEDFILAVVEVSFDGEVAKGGSPVYLHKPFQREPDFAAVSVNYELKELLVKGETSK